MQNYLNVIALSYRGISFVTPTGVYAEQTRRSVSEFQRRFGLPETGVVNEQTWNEIGRVYSDLIAEINVKSMQFKGSTIREGDSDYEYPYNISGGGK